MKHLILFIIFSIYPSITLTQDINIPDNLSIGNKNLNITNFKAISIEQYEYSFDGYLIIKLSREDTIIDSMLFNSSIFWVDNISDINQNNVYWYFPAMKLWAYSAVPDSHHSYNKLYSFIKTYLSFNNSLADESKSYLFGNKDSFSTSDFLMDNVIFLQKEDDNDVYVMYKTSFITSILNLNESPAKKFFVPISALKKLESLKDIPDGFIKSKIKVNIK